MFQYVYDTVKNSIKLKLRKIYFKLKPRVQPGEEIEDGELHDLAVKKLFNSFSLIRENIRMPKKIKKLKIG